MREREQIPEDIRRFALPITKLRIGEDSDPIA